jgi:predicted nucleotidyltransferase
MSQVVPQYAHWLARNAMAHSSIRTGSVQERIEEMVQRIVSQFNPDKVILFGSHARGEAGPDSDVDLLTKGMGSGVMV